MSYRRTKPSSPTARKFRNEQDLVAKALMLYMELQEQHKALRTQVQRLLEQADRGEVSELDIDAA